MSLNVVSNQTDLFENIQKLLFIKPYVVYCGASHKALATGRAEVCFNYTFVISIHGQHATHFWMPQMFWKLYLNCPTPKFFRLMVAVSFMLLEMVSSIEF